MWSWFRLPVARKCCCCVPVRRGVIIFGYVNLVVWFMMFPMLVFLLAERATRTDAGEGKASWGDGAATRLQLPLTTACVLLDAVMTVVLLIGAHKKRRLLLSVYVWGGACVQAAMLALDLMFLDARHILINVVFLMFLGLNMYLLYLVWSLTVVLRARDLVPPALLPAAAAAPARSREWRYVIRSPDHLVDPSSTH